MSLLFFKIFGDKGANNKFNKYMFITFIFAIIYCFIPSSEFGGASSLHMIVDPNKKHPVTKMLADTHPSHDIKSNDKLPLWKLFIVRLYYSFAVITTVGFGDMYPASLRLMTLTILEFIAVIHLLLQE